MSSVTASHHREDSCTLWCVIEIFVFLFYACRFKYSVVTLNVFKSTTIALLRDKNVKKL